MGLFVLFRITEPYLTENYGGLTHKEIEYVTNDLSFLVTKKEILDKVDRDTLSKTTFEIEEISEFSFHFEPTTYITI